MNFNERRVGIWLAVALALFYIVLIVGSRGAGDSHSTAENVGWLAAGFVTGALILSGLRIERRNPRVGGIMTIVGALPLGLFMFWLVLPGIVALVVTVLTVRRTFATQTTAA
ncbi:MAG: hypothetical protein O3B95_10325 [Chloroflexi bacterium]|nr:hypothetical protein [Chloroflexota bacterium]